MNFIPEDVHIGFLEVPTEISLIISIPGCGRMCEGCHSPWLRDPEEGEELTIQKMKNMMIRTGDYITNVVFFGGEQYPDQFLTMLKFVKAHDKKVSLFTAEKDVQPGIKKYLNYLKTGEYIQELGGLNSVNTNQRLWDLDNDKDITYMLQQKL